MDFQQMKNKIFAFLKETSVKSWHSLKRIYNHTLASIKSFYRDPTAIFLMIIYPIVLLLLFGALFATLPAQSYILEVQDFDQTPLSENLLASINNNSYIDINFLDKTEDPREYLQRTGQSACLIIPDGWTEEVYDLDSEIANITLIMNPYSKKAIFIAEEIEKTIYEFNLLYNGTNPLIDLEVKNFIPTKLKFIDFFIPGIIGVSIMNIGILGTISRQTLFREKRFYEKLVTTPIFQWEYALSELFWQIIIATFTILLAILTAWIAFGFSWGSFHVLIPVFVIFGLMIFSGVGMIISELIKNAQIAFGIGNLLTISMLLLSGIFFDVYSVPVLRIIARFSPLTYLVDGLRASMITRNYTYAGINLAICFALGVVTFLAGIYITKWKKK
ncbi:MAG: ABC transporter permease [Asgard group archaeon]|nr:ABC transporter permease [Asgard group archaeon]